MLEIQISMSSIHEKFEWLTVFKYFRNARNRAINPWLKLKQDNSFKKVLIILKFEKNKPGQLHQDRAVILPN